MLGEAAYIAFVTQQNNNENNKLTLQEAALTTQIQGINEAVTSKQEKLQTEFETLTKTMDGIAALKINQDQPFLLRQAQYTLELAKMNTQWSNNPNTTLVLLQGADSLLKKLPDPRLETIRKSIHADMTTLQSASPIDLPAILNQLHKTQAALDQLPFKPLEFKPEPTQAPTNWHDRLQASLKLLEKLVIVQRRNDHTSPLLSPLYQAILRERIAANLQQAQWAVLQNNALIYQQSLKEASKGIHHCFATDNPATQALLEDIKQLQEVSLTPQTLHITEALSDINKLITNDNNTLSRLSSATTSKRKQSL
jgi:uroporphyrin-3 C-methyltransferase